MALFFLLVGLEIKREVVEGALSQPSQVALPVIAARWAAWPCRRWSMSRSTGAIPRRCSGWAIPAATDIAFSLGVLAALGSRVPLALKVS